MIYIYISYKRIIYNIYIFFFFIIIYIVYKTVLCNVFLLWEKGSVYNIAYYMMQPLQLVGVCRAIVRVVKQNIHITVYVSLSE